jgi:hypothetical protein
LVCFGQKRSRPAEHHVASFPSDLVGSLSSDFITEDLARSWGRRAAPAYLSAARQNHYPAATAHRSRQVEGLRRLPLVVANHEPRAFSKHHRKWLAARVTRQILGGEAGRRQRLLQHAALPRIDAESGGVDADSQVPSRFAVARQAFRGRIVGARAA